MDKPALKRTPPLAQASFATPHAVISPCAPATRLVLHMSGSDARAIGRVGDFALDMPMNQAVTDGVRISARFGPGEWLLLAPSEAASTQRTIEAALGDHFHSVADISHRNYAFDVSGPAAARVINGGCPLDLGEGAFPTHSATRTVLGKAAIALMRFSDTYRIECWRSFAPYVFAFLRYNATEFSALTSAP